MSIPLAPEQAAEVVVETGRVGYALSRYIAVMDEAIASKEDRGRVEEDFLGVSRKHVLDVLRRQARDRRLPVEVGIHPELGVCIRYVEPNPFLRRPVDDSE